MASIDVSQMNHGNNGNSGGNGSSNGNENENGTFASAVQTHINRLSSNGDHKYIGTNNNHSNNSMHSTANTGAGSQKSSISRNIKIDDLRSYFHLPIVEVAKQLGICTTLLKRVCRTNKIKKWPYRQIRSIAKSIQSLEMASMNGMLADAEREKSQEQITFLKRSLEALIDDPSIPSKLICALIIVIFMSWDTSFYIFITLLQLFFFLRLRNILLWIYVFYFIYFEIAPPIAAISCISHPTNFTFLFFRLVHSRCCCRNGNENGSRRRHTARLYSKR